MSDIAALLTYSKCFLDDPRPYLTGVKNAKAAFIRDISVGRASARDTSS